MQDPFIPPIPVLRAWIEPVAEYFHLRTLPLHIHEILFACLFYHLIYEHLAGPFSNIFFNTTFSKLSPASKLRWNMHCASMVQSVTISLLTIYVIAVDNERWNMNLEERIWGHTGAAGLVQALACGYFLFDFIAMVRYFEVFGVAMLIHAASCLTTYILGFWPICNYYGCVFMLFELSTPFLNMHWFFDKLGMTGSRAQLYNGLTLLAMFFSARLVWGAFATVYIYRDIWQAWHLSSQPPMLSNPETMRYAPERILPKWVILLYMIGHITLYSLNFFWFNKMIAAVKKRFTKPSGNKPFEARIETSKEK